MVDERWERELNWIRTGMPVLVMLNLEPSDDWIRAHVRGEAAPAPRRQDVIVQGAWEAQRVVAEMAALKAKRRRPYGGALTQRWQP